MATLVVPENAYSDLKDAYGDKRHAIETLRERVPDAAEEIWLIGSFINLLFGEKTPSSGVRVSARQGGDESLLIAIIT